MQICILIYYGWMDGWIRLLLLSCSQIFFFSIMMIAHYIWNNNLVIKSLSQIESKQIKEDMLSRIEQNLQKLKQHNQNHYKLTRKEVASSPPYLQVQFSNKNNQFASKYIANISLSQTEQDKNKNNVANDDKYKFNDYFDNLNDIYQHLLIGCYKIDLQKKQLRVFIQVETTVRVKKIITIWISTPINIVETDILESLQIVKNKCMANEQQMLDESEAKFQVENTNKYLITKLTDILIHYIKEQRQSCENINLNNKSFSQRKDIKSIKSNLMQIQEKNSYNERIANMEDKIQAINAQIFQLRRERQKLSATSQMSHSLGLKEAKMGDLQQWQNSEKIKQLSNSFMDLTEYVREVNDNMLGFIQNLSSKSYIQSKFMQVMQYGQLEQPIVSQYQHQYQEPHNNTNRQLPKPKKRLMKRRRATPVSQMSRRSLNKSQSKSINNIKQTFEDWIDRSISTKNIRYSQKQKHKIYVQTLGIRIFSKIQIKSRYKFGLIVTRITKLQIGVIDRQEAKKNKIFNKIQNMNMYHIDNLKHCYDGTSFKTLENGWFKQKIEEDEEQVRVQVTFDPQQGTIEWLVNNKNLIGLKKAKLKDKNIVWIPFAKIFKDCQVQFII